MPLNHKPTIPQLPQVIQKLTAIIPQQSTKLQSNPPPHLGSGLVGGSVSGIESDENGNLTFSPEKFALGLLGGAAGSKAVTQGFKYLKENPQVKEAVVKELADTLALGFDKARQKYPLLSLLEPRYIVQNERGRIVQAKAMISELEKKEQKGIYNVAFNGKNATRIFKDLEAVDNHIMLFKGYHDNTKDKGKGAKHIKEHFKPFSEGFISQDEYLNLGKDLREYLKKYKEPFVEKGASIYEWFNDSGTKFRLVVNDNSGLGHKSAPPSAKDEIITYFSNRFSQKGINFKNPKVQKDYEKFNNNKFTAQQIKDIFEKSFFNENQLVLTLDKEYANYTKPLKERDDLKQVYDSFRKSYFSNKDSRIKKDFAFYLEKEQAYKKAIDRDIAENLKIDTKRYKQDLDDWLGDVEYLHPVVRNGKKPKIFYHGSGSNAIETFILQHSDGFPKAVWLSPNKKVAQSYSKHFGSVYEVYLVEVSLILIF
ncbi:hypothetical protein [Helicobacter cinaedi]|uniref:ADP-ribosyltransferase-containing protein n=1 Tax=Helicobacter cinaedi TaxID=213 RepID=UPI0013150B3B|nr:hypothetical protein [Helicobacter cinaedi]